MRSVTLPRAPRAGESGLSRRDKPGGGGPKHDERVEALNRHAMSRSVRPAAFVAGRATLTRFASEAREPTSPTRRSATRGRGGADAGKMPAVHPKCPRSILRGARSTHGAMRSVTLPRAPRAGESGLSRRDKPGGGGPKHDERVEALNRHAMSRSVRPAAFVAGRATLTRFASEAREPTSPTRRSATRGRGGADAGKMPAVHPKCPRSTRSARGPTPSPRGSAPPPRRRRAAGRARRRSRRARSGRDPSARGSSRGGS